MSRAGTCTSLAGHLMAVTPDGGSRRTDQPTELAAGQAGLLGHGPLAQRKPGLYRCRIRRQHRWFHIARHDRRSARCATGCHCGLWASSPTPTGEALLVPAMGSVPELASDTTLPMAVRALAALVTCAIASVVVAFVYRQARRHKTPARGA
jgi:hypothetical protein